MVHFHLRLKRCREVEGVKGEGVAGVEDQQQGEEEGHLAGPVGLVSVEAVLQVQRSLEQVKDPPAP